METAKSFHIYVTGQIESAKFPLGPDGSDIFLKYKVIAGPDWEFISGLKDGITQSCSTRGRSYELVFNMPIEFTIKSTCPFGWPQLIISLYGKNAWSTVTSLGYSRVHIPIFPGTGKQIVSPILIPKCTNLIADLTSWISGKNPELKNPDILGEGDKNKGLEMEAYGDIILSLQTISRGSLRMGYDWGQKE